MKHIVTLILFSACLESTAQNLVQNPSFENYDTCPNTVSQLYYCANWEQLYITSDYFNACGFGDASFNNYFGIQCPNSGNAYVGSIGLWSVAGTKEREIIGSVLDSTLAIGQKYYCTYHLSLADNSSWCTGINKFGLKLSTNPFPHDSTLIDNNPFLYSDSVVLDTAGWVQFKYSFIADSAYQYIALGVFFEDSLLTIDHTLTPVNKTYFYIDDVCLSSDSNTCNFSVTHTCYPNGIDNPASSTMLKIYPNPFTDFLFVDAEKEKMLNFEVIDITGRIIQKGKFFEKHELSSENWSAGIYILRVFANNNCLISKKIIKASQ